MYGCLLSYGNPYPSLSRDSKCHTPNRIDNLTKLFSIEASLPDSLAVGPKAALGQPGRGFCFLRMEL